MRALPIFLMTLALASRAGASPVELQPATLPPPLPTSLAMRASTPVQPPATESVTEPAGFARRLRDLFTELGPKLDEQVIFRFDIGFGIDGGQPYSTAQQPEARLASGALLDEVNDYGRLRAYGFGDAVLGTRGLLVPSLNSYFAAQFRFDNNIRSAHPIPTAYDGEDVNDILVRSAYAETDGLFEHPGLKPIFIRAGRQFRYEPLIAHFDGVTGGYDSRGIGISVFGGRRATLYGFDIDRLADNGLLFGANLHVDVDEWTSIPMGVDLDTVFFDNANHTTARLFYRYRPETLLSAQIRLRDGKAAQQQAMVRARLSKVTVLTTEVTNSTERDVFFDLLYHQGDATDARRYLDLGQVVPRTVINVRAGTVIKGNIDVLIRSALAVRSNVDDEHPASTFSAGYGELGAALELRYRRNLRLGVSGLYRRFRRTEDPAFTFAAEDMVPDPLPQDSGGTGEKGFYEGGVIAEYSPGARNFKASSEFYGRALRFVSPYVAEDLRDIEVRAGGRFAVEGWFGTRLRLRGEYDVSTRYAKVAPELRGVKTLRVLAEATF